jgi:transcriptional regulator with GAF, ATPase, and Fis domain
MSTQALDTMAVTDVDRCQRRTLKDLLDAYERELILKALAESGGHQRRAARALGVLPTTLNEKMRRLNLRPAPGGPHRDQQPRG